MYVRESLWRLIKLFGIPEKMIPMISLLYDGFVCSIIHDGDFSRWFEVRREKWTKTRIHVVSHVVPDSD